jgi:hypothetical protein
MQGIGSDRCKAWVVSGSEINNETTHIDKMSRTNDKTIFSSRTTVELKRDYLGFLQGALSRRAGLKTFELNFTNPYLNLNQFLLVTIEIEKDENRDLLFLFKSCLSWTWSNICS